MAGAFLGALATLLVFLFTMRWDKRKDNKKDKKEIKQNNLYIRSLIIFAVQDMKAQADLIKSYYEEQNMDPIFCKEMKFLIMLDLPKLVKLLEQDKCFHSYLSEFGDTIENISNFRSISSSASYLHEVVDQIDKTIIEAHNVERELNKKLNLVFGKAKELASEIAKDNFKKLPELSGLINRHIDINYEEVRHVRSLYRRHIEPFIKDLEKFSDISMVQILTDNLEKVRFIYYDLLLRNENLVNLLREDYENITNVINTLEIGAKSLIEKYNV